MDLISIERKSGLEFSVQVRGHAVTSDMAKDAGGLDGGPSPTELLAGSLGACMAMIVQNHCQRHGYEGDVGVSLTIEYADKPRRIGRIVADLELPQSVPEDKIEAIKKLAKRCPIHATLEHPPALDIDVV
jgi:putative redox protein